MNAVATNGKAQQEPSKLRLTIKGMMPGVGARKRWEEDGGAVIAAALLKAVDAAGEWACILDRQYHVRRGGCAPTIEIRAMDNRGWIVVRICPGGNDSAVTCRLVPPRTMPPGLVAVMYTRLRELSGKELYKDGLTIDCPRPVNGVIHADTVRVTAGLPDKLEGRDEESADDGGELAEKHEPPSSAVIKPGTLPTVPPPAMDDHDPAVRLMEAARQATAIAASVAQLRDVRAELVAAMEKVEQLRRKEAEVLAGISTKELYEAIAVIEEAQADAKKFLT